MEKKVSSTGMYETTYSGYVFVGKLSTPTKIGLTDQTKVALLEYLTESDDFHKLVCDITGTERKQVKVSQELEKLKEDYSYVCDRYKKEQQKSNYLLNKWRKEAARRLEAEKERDNAERHHKFIVDEIFSMLKEVECSSVRGIVDELKSERANGKLLAEENELCRRENEELKLNYDKVSEEKKNLLSNLDYLNGKNKSQQKEYEVLQALYSDVLLTNTMLTMEKEEAEKTIADKIKEIERLKKCYQIQTDLAQEYDKRCQKLQGKLNKASKRYGELIKTISDRAIKSI